MSQDLHHSTASIEALDHCLPPNYRIRRHLNSAGVWEAGVGERMIGTNGSNPLGKTLAPPSKSRAWTCRADVSAKLPLAAPMFTVLGSALLLVQHLAEVL